MSETPIEKIELWGITLPSMLACCGSILAVAGARLWLAHAWGFGLGIIGLCLIGLALRLNWIKRLTSDGAKPISSCISCCSFYP